jgi:hypothetical protein
MHASLTSHKRVVFSIAARGSSRVDQLGYVVLEGITIDGGTAGSRDGRLRYIVGEGTTNVHRTVVGEGASILGVHFGSDV